MTDELTSLRERVAVLEAEATLAQMLESGEVHAHGDGDTSPHEAELLEHVERLQAIADAALVLMTQADGSLIGTGYVPGPGNMEMVMTASVNNVVALRDALNANMTGEAP